MDWFHGFALAHSDSTGAETRFGLARLACRSVPIVAPALDRARSRAAVMSGCADFVFNSVFRLRPLESRFELTASPIHRGAAIGDKLRIGWLGGGPEDEEPVGRCALHEPGWRSKPNRARIAGGQ